MISGVEVGMRDALINGVACRSAAENGVNMFSVFLSQIVSGIHLLIVILAALAAHNGGL